MDPVVVRPDFAGSERRLGIAPREEHQVLPGEFVELVGERQSVGGKLPQNLLFAHFVLRLDRHLGIFRTELDQSDPAGWLQRLADRLQHRLGLRESWYTSTISTRSIEFSGRRGSVSVPNNGKMFSSLAA